MNTEFTDQELLNELKKEFPDNPANGGRIRGTGTFLATGKSDNTSAEIQVPSDFLEIRKIEQQKQFFDLLKIVLPTSLAVAGLVGLVGVPFMLNRTSKAELDAMREATQAMKEVSISFSDTAKEASKSRNVQIGLINFGKPEDQNSEGVVPVNDEGVVPINKFSPEQEQNYQEWDQFFANNPTEIESYRTECTVMEPPDIRCMVWRDLQNKQLNKPI